MSSNLLTSSTLNCRIDLKRPCQPYIEKHLCFRTGQDLNVVDFLTYLGVSLNQMNPHHIFLLHCAATQLLGGNEAEMERCETVTVSFFYSLCLSECGSFQHNEA